MTDYPTLSYTLEYLYNDRWIPANVEFATLKEAELERHNLLQRYGKANIIEVTRAMVQS